VRANISLDAALLEAIDAAAKQRGLDPWRHQPEKRGRCWEASIRVQRNRLADHLDDNPSLRPLLPQALASAYRDAALEAAAETGLARSMFPDICPWTVGQVSDHGFWPG